jgi:tetratricopeptide (TPR) repeat protein
MAEGVNDPQAYLMLSSLQLNAGKSEGARRILRSGMAANPDNIRLRVVLTAMLVKAKEYDEAISMVKETARLEPKNKAHQLKLASLYWKSERKDEVQALFNQMIADDDDPIAVRILAAEFYARWNEMDRALSVIDEAIKKEPQNIKLRLALAHLHIAMREHGLALAALQTALGLVKDEADPDLLKAKNQLARIYISQGEIETAKKYTDEIIAVSGSNVDAQFSAGQIYLQQKEGLNAVSAFRTVVAERPEAVMGHLYLAQSHLLNSEKQLALDTLTNGLEANPKAVELRRALAGLRAAEKDFDAAEKELRLIVEQNPSEVRVQADLADFLIARRKENEAISIYQQMVAEQADIPAGYLKLAAIYRAQQKSAAATAILEKGYKTIPQSTPILTELIKGLIAAGDYAKAIDLVKTRLKADDRDILAHNLLGEIYLTQKQYKSAKLAFDRAIAIRPEWQEPHNNLALVYLAQGKKDEAVANLMAALDKNPKNAAAYLTLGHLYINEGQEDKVIGIYEKALEAIPDLWPAANNLAYLLAKKNHTQDDLGRAQALALRAVKLQPKQPGVIDTLGWVHYLRGENELAITELKKAVDRAPDSAVINFHLGMALMKANRLEEARERLEKAATQEDFAEREVVLKTLKKLRAG